VVSSARRRAALVVGRRGLRARVRGDRRVLLDRDRDRDDVTALLGSTERGGEEGNVSDHLYSTPIRWIGVRIKSQINAAARRARTNVLNLMSVFIAGSSARRTTMTSSIFNS
jgi:hypothetical protein